MLVTRQHGVWIIDPASNKAPVIADVIADLRRSSTMSAAWTTAVTTILRRSPALLGAIRAGRTFLQSRCEAGHNGSYLTG
jgi:hypothetical protein